MNVKTKQKNLIIEGSNCCEDYEWEDITEVLTEYMNEINPEGYWTGVSKNFGWRKLDGYKDVFHATKGIEMLRQVLPDTECSFRIYKYRTNGIAINNAHHDSPMWAEWYYIKKFNGKEV